MSIGIKKLNHVNVTVPAALEAAAKDFYGVLLGLRQIAKPAGSRQNVGAWYDLEGAQIHLSPEDGVNNEASDRHVCYQVNDIETARRKFRDAGIDLIPDSRPVAGQTRFFVRDPGGNLLEITQTKE